MSKKKAEVARRYFEIEEVATKAGLSVAEIIHLAAHGDFSLYVLADNWDALAFIHNEETGRWEPASAQRPNFVSGPLRLYPCDLQRFEGNPAAVIQRVIGDTVGCDEHEPDDEWEYRLVGNGISLAGCKLVLMAADFSGLQENDVAQEKPLLTKERNTLLKIIAALAHEAECDLHHATKSSESLSALTTDMGIRVCPKAIENHLKAALSLGAKKPEKH